MLVHTLTFLLRDENDLKMADKCFNSLQQTKDTCIVVYNQGYMTNSELSEYLCDYRFTFHILGCGENEGIPVARQRCMKYIWENLPQYKFVSEIHVDMIFPANWHVPLIKYLETHDEPMICPGIITQFGEIHPWKKGTKSIDIPLEPEEIISLCQSLREEKLCEGFVHPVIHKIEALKKVGGYDTRLLKGKQGYEDDSLLLGYRYYMGTRTGWKPKCYLASYVYHASMAQRTTLQNITEEFMINLNGLFKQYGSYGFLQLAEIHGSKDFLHLAKSVLEP
ncbi:hypothetical protein [Thermincola potens]|uniref:Glycosyl transferase family 2 n=1 Tax=Thermincola potens (strain JR) TaxID=635013 RepID=D5XDV4_THEPJ|nr:hypothetical protein [Thermincola potens]ADG81825.1 conserved hypothetical protein [Thermincola potens JR]